MRCLFVLLIVFQATCAIAQVREEPVVRYGSLRHPVYSTNGMVTAQNSIAAEIGAQVLADGGNAVDAAVAVGFSLAVTLPRAGNIGGGGFMLVYDAESVVAVSCLFTMLNQAIRRRSTIVKWRRQTRPAICFSMRTATPIRSCRVTVTKRQACPVPLRVCTTPIKNSAGCRGSGSCSRRLIWRVMALALRMISRHCSRPAGNACVRTRQLASIFTRNLRVFLQGRRCALRNGRATQTVGSR